MSTNFMSCPIRETFVSCDEKSVDWVPSLNLSPKDEADEAVDENDEQGMDVEISVVDNSDSDGEDNSSECYRETSDPLSRSHERKESVPKINQLEVKCADLQDECEDLREKLEEELEKLRSVVSAATINDFFFAG